MSLDNSQFTFYTLQLNKKDVFTKEVNRISRETDGGPRVNPPKRQRMTDDSGFGTQSSGADSSQNLNWKGAAGTIIKLKVENFMCHKRFEIEFNDKINFIVGQNGSGKSAILTALVVGLGGVASTTGRGSSLKDFIRKGESTSLIEIVINNSGMKAFKPAEYGDRITVKRTLKMAGSTVKLLSYRSKDQNTDCYTQFSQYLTARQMEDLRNMTLTLGIQVANPISVLDQNTARHFLNESKPEQKYELFMKATNLEALQIKYQETARELQIAEQSLFAKEKQIRANKEELQKAKKKYDLIVNMQRDHIQKNYLQLELLWARERDVVSSIDTRKGHVSELEKTLHKWEQMLCGREEEAIVQKLEELAAKINAVHEEEKSIEEEREKLKSSYRDVREQHKKLELDKQRLKDKIASEERSIDDYKKEIGNQERRMTPEFADLLNQQRQKANDLTDQLNTNSTEERNKSMQLQDLKLSLNASKSSLDQARRKQNAAQNQIRKLKQDIQEMESAKSNLDVYGGFMPQLVREIDDAYNKRRFSKKPVGPIGSYIRVREQKWTLAIESIIQGRLPCFVVNNSDDERVLKEIMKRVIRNGNEPGIITTKFVERVHNTRDTSARSDRYSTVLDMLEISEPMAANVLIDLSSIETILLIPSSEECHALLSSRERVPTNCRMAYTLAGDRYFPAPNYRTYAGTLQYAHYLQTSREEVVNNLKSTLQEAEYSFQQAADNVRDINREIEGKQRLISELQNEVLNLQRLKVKINSEIDKLKDQEVPDLNTVSSLREELQEKVNKVAKAQEDIQALTEKIKEKQTEEKDISKNAREVTERLSKVQEELQPLLTEQKRLNDEKRDMCKTKVSVQKNLQNAKDKKKGTEKVIDELNVEREKIIKDIQEFQDFLRGQATERGEELPDFSSTQREVTIIENEVRSITRRLESATKSLGGSEDQIRQEYETKRDSYEATKSRYDLLHKNVSYIRKALNVRQTIFSTQRGLYCAVVSHQFGRVLLRRNFSGKLNFDHRLKTLNLEVGPVDKGERAGLGTVTLSGGERSFTTMAFIIALWNVTDLPFYFLDEFDVFMDDNNRRLTLMLLLRFAKEKGNYQFGFLTPLDTQIKAEPDVTIHGLQNPRG